MSEAASALQFPCQFPIKAMGLSSVEFDIHVIEIVRRHAGDVHEGAVTSRPSKGGKYTSITVTITATSRGQLDAIYQDLSDSPLVLTAL
ncbi:MAG: YbeD family protein [Gammaproteobacteria bacterium]